MLKLLPKPCTQELCSFYEECPYSHDIRACLAGVVPDED